jgi:hypothetical protein
MGIRDRGKLVLMDLGLQVNRFARVFRPFRYNNTLLLYVFFWCDD